MRKLSAATNTNNYKYKLVLLGNQSVGKSSILSRFVHDTFEADYQATIGVDFISKTLFTDTGVPVRLQLWDTAGQERFRSLLPSYIRDVALAVVVFDITVRASFDSVPGWIADVRNRAGRRRGAAGIDGDPRDDDATIMLVGNKCDLSDRRKVSTDEMEALALKYKVLCIETSAKEGINVKILFRRAVNHMLANTTAGEPALRCVPLSERVDIGVPQVLLTDQARTSGSTCVCTIQ